MLYTPAACPVDHVSRSFQTPPYTPSIYDKRLDNIFVVRFHQLCLHLSIKQAATVWCAVQMQDTTLDCCSLGLLAFAPATSKDGPLSGRSSRGRLLSPARPSKVTAGREERWPVHNLSLCCPSGPPKIMCRSDFGRRSQCCRRLSPAQPRCRMPVLPCWAALQPTHSPPT